MLRKATEKDISIPEKLDDSAELNVLLLIMMDTIAGLEGHILFPFWQYYKESFLSSLDLST